MRLGLGLWLGLGLGLGLALGSALGLGLGLGLELGLDRGRHAFLNRLARRALAHHAALLDERERKERWHLELLLVRLS